MRIVLASREVYPLGGGGIGQFVSAAAQLLSRVAEVTVITTSIWEPEYRRLRAQSDPRLPDDSVRFEFVPEPHAAELEGWYHVMHLYGARLLERLRELYDDRGPDLIEFPDFLGEGFVTLQAAEALDPLLAQTCITVRVHTTAEICEVLDGFLKPDRGSRALHAMERFALANADRLIWQGGDILGTYQRFYGARALAADMRIRYPFRGAHSTPHDDAGFELDGPVKILYAGRLERRKGMHHLVQAARGLDRDDFRLQLVGADSDTGPLGVSMRSQLELAIADDPRIELRPALARGELAAAIREHDLVAVPSLWECWPYAALEAMCLNRPVLGSPVGGLAEMVVPGRSGWLTDGTGPAALEAGLETALGQRPQLEAMIRTGAPAATVAPLVAEAEVLSAYQHLARAAPRRHRRPQARAPRHPVVSAIVPYYRASRFVEATVASLLAQTYPELEIVLVNDGSFEEDDWIVAELAARHPVTVVTQMNQGLGAARNFGVGQTRGRYIFPLDADNLAEPGFVARCVEILEGRPELAYVTSWSTYIDERGVPLGGPAIGYQPLGNHAALNADENVAGDAAAVLRRRVFAAGFAYSEELTSFEDWHLYRELQRAGWLGTVIPERLLRYRVRPDSLQAQFAQPRRERLHGEIDALMRENEVRWTSSSA